MEQEIDYIFVNPAVFFTVCTKVCYCTSCQPILKLNIKQKGLGRVDNIRVFKSWTELGLYGSEETPKILVNALKLGSFSNLWVTFLY